MMRVSRVSSRQLNRTIRLTTYVLGNAIGDRCAVVNIATGDTLLASHGPTLNRKAVNNPYFRLLLLP